MSKEGQRIPVRELGIRFSFIDGNAQSPLKSLQYSSKLSISHSSSRKTSLTRTDKSSADTKKKKRRYRGDPRTQRQRPTTEMCRLNTPVSLFTPALRHSALPRHFQDCKPRVPEHTAAPQSPLSTRPATHLLFSLLLTSREELLRKDPPLGVLVSLASLFIGVAVTLPSKEVRQNPAGQKLPAQLHEFPMPGEQIALPFSPPSLFPLAILSLLS